MLNLIFPTWLFFGFFFIDSWNLMNSISFITYRYMLATIFISHLTILGLSYKSIQSYQRKWSRNETWVRLTTYFHEYSKSTYCFHQILCYIYLLWFSHLLKEKKAYFCPIRIFFFFSTEKYVWKNLWIRIRKIRENMSWSW